MTRLVARNWAQVEDFFGNVWDVAEERATVHGWAVCLGWPAGERRGKGGAGGVRVIVTDDLAVWLEARRWDTLAAHALPLGTNAIKRLRRLMGYNRYQDAELWWIDRLDDLEALPGAEFARRHGVSEGAVSQWHTRLIAARLRPAGWWRSDASRELLASPTAIAADALGVSASSVRRLRIMIKAGA